jgi:hypothetical protein
MKLVELTRPSISATISLTSVICARVTSLSSGDEQEASSTSLFCNLSFVLLIAASNSLTASSLMPWSTWASASVPSVPSSPSSWVLVIEANSNARDSLKWASAMISDSPGYNSCLYAKAALKSTTAPGNLGCVRNYQQKSTWSIYLSFSREISARRS